MNDSTSFKVNRHNCSRPPLRKGFAGVKLILLFILMTIPVVTFSQKHGKALLKSDPLVGNWKFNPQLSTAKTKPPVLYGAEIISIPKGRHLGIAMTNEPTKNPVVLCYFQISKDEQKIYGTITESNNGHWVGKGFSFQYRYQEESDVLMVIVKNEVYCFSRII